MLDLEVDVLDELLDGEEDVVEDVVAALDEDEVAELEEDNDVEVRDDDELDDEDLEDDDVVLVSTFAAAILAPAIGSVELRV